MSSDAPKVGKYAKAMDPQYIFTSICIVCCCFLAILLIPYWYDQTNVQDFTRAEKAGNLIIREYGPIIIADDIAKARESAGSNGSRLTSIFRDKRLISLDYIQQMQSAREIPEHKFVLFTTLVSFILIGLAAVVLKFVRPYVFRTPSLVFVFLGTLVLLQGFGLPHTNQKFHFLVGVFYAALFALSDFLQTLDLGLEHGRPAPEDNDKDKWTGYLSSLQYKHRFWTVVFNLFAVALITLLATVSFKILDLFLIVFGESFVKNPLIGLLGAVTIGLLWAFVGIFRPIRRHIVSIENAMKRDN